jgi:hypothetical protein
MGFFVRASKRHTFRVIEEKWTPRREAKAVPRETYPLLGFNYSFTLEEAQARAKQINLQNSVDKSKAVGAARRLEHESKVSTAFLPRKYVTSFLDEINETYLENKSRLETILKHWAAAELLISKLELDPKNFFQERNRIFNFYKMKSWSPDYIKRITRILNLWGGHYCRKNNLFYQSIPKLSTHQSQKLVDLREDKKEISRAALSLEWTDLKNVKSKFVTNNLESNWNWLFIGLWFGLRPIEIDNLKKKKLWEITFDKEHNLKVLKVYQTKLTNLPKDKRWKTIPIYFKEQKEAADLIEQQNFKRPLNKTHERYFDKKVETYSPRKGFTDLMLERGFELEDISNFLGHANIEMTWRHYKNKQKFKLPKRLALEKAS